MITRISKNQPSTSILHTLHLLCQCNILLHLLLVQNLPLLASSQPPINPSSQNCYAAPCTYLGECRDYSGVCGDTVAYCNVESTWVPACGGGAGLEKPSQPVGGSVVVVATSTATAASNNVNGNGGGSGGGGSPPTVSPTTAWEKWISQKKNDDPPANVDNEQNNQQLDNNNNNASPTTNSNNNNKANQNENQDGTNYVPNNQTGTFDANTWGYYGEEEEEGMLDKMKFWQGDDEDGENNAAASAMESSRTEVVFLVCLGVAWAILL